MQRTLIRGAAIDTMDRQGDLASGDILVTDASITEIAAHIHADDAEIIDASGCIIIPGLVNAHMHTWQTALRGLAANWTLLEYFQKMHAGLATVFEPADLYIATLAGALPQQPHAGAQRRGDPRAARIRHSCGVLSRHAQARSEAGRDTVLGAAASAGRTRTAAACAPGA